MQHIEATEAKVKLKPISEPMTVLTNPTGLVKALVEAHGEPRNRTWSAKYVYKLRNGAVQSEGTLRDTKLSRLLDQLSSMEVNMVFRYSGHKRLDNMQRFSTLQVFYIQNLYYSLNYTMQRWCKRKRLMVIEKPM